MAESAVRPSRRPAYRAAYNRARREQQRKLCTCGASIAGESRCCRGCLAAARAEAIAREDSQIIDAYRAGLSYSEIAERVGCAADRVGIRVSAMRAAGVHLPYRHTPPRSRRVRGPNG